ncbi:MAG TPA: hypothetical protein VK026_04940 [Paenalcaligenes sp.]|nr:hypothetical protein [Paenalcaligenes sp.]
MHRLTQFLISCLLSVYLAPLSAAPEIVNWETPRLIGWMTGDVITHRLELRSPKAQPIVPASLPAAGPLSYWLNLRSVNLEQRNAGGYHHYVLSLDYQSFYVPLDVNTRQIPELTLRFGQEDGESPALLTIPAWSFTMSPLRPVSLTSAGSLPLLHEDIYSQPQSLQPLITRSVVLFGVALLLGILLLHRYTRWPFHKRTARPFAQAQRNITRLRKGGELPHYQQAHRALHAALNQLNAQRTLLHEDLAAFIAQHPAYSTLSPQLEQFFHASQQLFFSSQALTDDELAQGWQQLSEISQALAKVERRTGP